MKPCIKTIGDYSCWIEDTTANGLIIVYEKDGKQSAIGESVIAPILMRWVWCNVPVNKRLKEARDTAKVIVSTRKLPEEFVEPVTRYISLTDRTNEFGRENSKNWGKRASETINHIGRVIFE